MAARARSVKATLLAPCRESCASSPVASTSKSTIWSKPYHVATVTAATEPPPFLDFLYPSFGFFSRALPPSLPPFSSSPVPSLNLPSSTTSRGSSPPSHSPWSRRPAVAKETSCICGRTPQSCLRCRAVSTSARFSGAMEARKPRIEEVSEKQEPEKPPIPNSHPATRTPPRPPRPRRKGQITTTSSLPPAVAAVVDKYDSLLPSVRTGGATPKARTPRSARWDLAMARNAYRRLFQAIESVPSVEWESVPVSQQLDTVRILSRLSRKPFTRQSDSVGHEDEEETKALRREVGLLILRVLDLIPAGTASGHARSLATLRIDGLALQGALPTLDSPSFNSDLRVIFPPSSSPPPLPPSTSTSPSLTPAAIDSTIRQSQRTVLSILLDGWENSDDGPQRAVELIHGWDLENILGPDFERKSRGGTLASYDDILRRRYGQLLSRLPPSPAEWFQDTNSPPQRLSLGPHLVIHLALSGSPLSSLAIYDALDDVYSKLDREVQLRTGTALLEGLVRDRFEMDAARVSQVLEDATRQAIGADAGLVAMALEVIAKVSAAAGRVDHVKATLKRKGAIAPNSNHEGAARLIRAAAQKGDMLALQTIFTEAKSSATSPLERSHLWNELVRAYSRVGDLGSGLKALNQLVEEGDSPSLPLLNSLLAGFAASGAVDQAHHLLRRFPSFGHHPNLVTFNTLSSLHANLRDPESVERLMRYMNEINITPDRFTWATRMNAYLQVGLFERALEIFDFLQAHQDPLMRPDTVITNTLLKASVLAGMPASITLSVFRNALAKGLRPNAQSYTHVIHALCVAGLTDDAEDLFMMMDGDGENLPLPMQAVRPDAHIFSALIYGYLQQNDVNLARACLREMRSRQIEPTSVTYGVIVALFLRQDDGANGLQRALELAKDFLEDQPLRRVLRRTPIRRDRPLARGEELLSVFNPIVHAFAKAGDVDQALQYFRHVLHEGPIPSIVLHTALLDAYRRSEGHVDSINTIWAHIHQLATDAFLHLPTPPLPGHFSKRVEPTQANALCRPLSIYIKALSAHRRFEEVLSTWNQLASEGFSFDASNWNVLGEAASRSGDVELALWICEKVLCREDDEELGSGFGSLDVRFIAKVSSSLETRRRLYQNQQPAEPQDQQSTSIREMLGKGAKYNDEGPVQGLLNIHHYWHPHDNFLQALEEALKGVPADQRKDLVEEHPRAFDAMRQRRARLMSVHWMKESGS